MEPSRRVLIVEDDAHIAELLRMHLRDEGYAVEHAADGHEGMRRLEEGGWDALVLDLMLPGVDGLEICKRARGMARYTPIIITSARSSEVHRILGLELGADDYWPSPSRCWSWWRGYGRCCAAATRWRATPAWTPARWSCTAWPSIRWRAPRSWTGARWT